MAVRLIPSITIAGGKAREAIRFYERVLGRKNIGIVAYGDMPGDPQNRLPAEAKNLVAHAMAEIGDAALRVRCPRGAAREQSCGGKRLPS